MSNNQKMGRGLVGLGWVLLIAGALLHMIAGYPRISAMLAASNLDAGLQPAMRTVWLLFGWAWIMIGVVTLMAAFTETRIRKGVVMFCGLGLLAQIPLWVGLMGWFAGNEMMLASGLLVTAGGLMLRRVA